MTKQPSKHSRSAAFAKRAWKQQRSTAVWLAAVAGAALGVVVFIGAGEMNAVTNVSDLIPHSQTGLVSVYDADGTVAPLTAYLMSMTPAILGMLIAVVATLTLPGVVADDIGGGGIEVLLASPIPRRALFTAYLGAGFLLTAASWGVATLAFAVAATLTALTIGTVTTLSFAYVAALIVLPLSMGVWSATATLFGALLYPGALESKAGMNGGPIRLLAIFPALIIVPALLAFPAATLVMLAIVVAVTIAASVLIIFLTARGFSSTRVLST
ncbi:hypothetical protein AB0O95_03830 [Rhodoglobus sp. NPDC076762]